MLPVGRGIHTPVVVPPLPAFPPEALSVEAVLPPAAVPVEVPPAPVVVVVAALPPTLEVPLS
ncbi:MAG: hypothetical protein QM784_00675 [Polyangiaceae bacterium]